MKKNEIIELLKPKCNGYDLPLSLNIELIAEILVNKQDEAINYTRCCTELKVIEELKDLAYEVCPLHRTDDLDDIIERL